MKLKTHSCSHFQNQDQNQKSFNVPQMGKFVCHSSVRIEQSNSKTDNIK